MGNKMIEICDSWMEKIDACNNLEELSSMQREEHLNICDECHAYYETSKLLHKKSGYESLNLWESFQDKKEHKFMHSMQRKWVGALAFASLLIGLTAGFLGNNSYNLIVNPVTNTIISSITSDYSGYSYEDYTIEQELDQIYEISIAY